MAEPTFWMEKEQLLRFFRRHKTELSCMENPHIFLSQLRDHDLIPEDRYQKVSRMRSNNNIKKGLYDILDWLEKEQSRRIIDFWECVFKETIMNQYPTLRLLHNDLMNEESDEGKRKKLSADEDGEKKKTNSVKKKRKLRSRSTCDEEEEEEHAGPSTRLTPRRKSKKLSPSPLKKGQKSDIWTWDIYKTQLPVTCGQKAGTLDRQRLAKGEKCIVLNKQWFTPGEFERFAGKKSFKNWKLSIRCQGKPLDKLVKEGHLKAGRYKGGCKKAKRSLVLDDDHSITVSDEEDDGSDQDKEDQVSSSSRESSTDDTDDERQTEERPQQQQQPQTSTRRHDRGRKVFSVTCGALAATLHRNRFASGTRGKSIRTETSWMTPEEFVKEASGPDADATWRKDILYEGEPLSVLIEADILKIHPLLCKCRLCKPDSEDLDNQKNDDECCVCKGEEEEGDLVECDHCPRSFHQRCHLPHVEDDILRDDRPWMCTFCVFRTSQLWLYPDQQTKEDVVSRQISQRMLQCQYLLLYLCSADGKIFATNPCLYLQDYSTVIKTPMWLGKVADKLQEQLYQTVGEFVSDIQLIFTNCATYNRDNAKFLAKGNGLKELFDGEFKSVFNISDN